MTHEPDVLYVAIDDDRVHISMGGGSWHLPVGPVALYDTELRSSDPPDPVDLTNALAAVRDHLDDVIRDEPAVVTARSVVATGPHAIGLARVEIGLAALPGGYELGRDDAEEVFRTLVAEPSADRRFNPGLPSSQTDSIIGTCCVILAIMRRLDLARMEIPADAIGPIEAAAEG
ncbi:MAG: hypothetical protein ACR2O6_09865 [Ilumatobacteraceae bacterium]